MAFLNGCFSLNIIFTNLKMMARQNGNGGQKKDILGQKKRLVKGFDNNMLYAIGGGALVLYGFSQGWFDSILGGGSAPTAPASVSANPNPDPQGTPVTITGAFNPAVPQAFWGVTNSTGQLISSGTLGNNVSTFSQSIGTFPIGTYNAVVSDSPVQSVATPVGTGGGQQVLAVNQQLASNYIPTIATQQSPTFGAPQAGPENLTLG